MKYLVVLLAIFSMSAMAVSIDDIPKPAKMQEVTTVNTILTTAIMPDGTTMPAIKGYVVGLEAPPMGDYQVQITNGNGFKKPRFTLMRCTLTKYLEEINYNAEDVGVLSTAFTLNGEVYNSMGFYTGTTAYPSENYQVIINGGKDQTLWNSMKCTIK